MNKNNPIEKQKRLIQKLHHHHQLGEILELKSHTLIKQYDCIIGINH